MARTLSIDDYAKDGGEEMHCVLIDDSAKDGGRDFTQCMIGICPLVTHSYQNLQLQHKILTAATIDLGCRNFIVTSTLS